MTLQDYERYFKQFQYREALQETLKSGHPEVVLTVLEEIVQRNVLYLALSHFDVPQLLLLLRFLVDRICHPNYSALLLEVASLVLGIAAPILCFADLYSCGLGLSQQVFQALQQLRATVDRECQLQTRLLSLKGVVEALQVTALAQP